jgi:hypothetical protein
VHGRDGDGVGHPHDEAVRVRVDVGEQQSSSGGVRKRSDNGSCRWGDKITWSRDLRKDAHRRKYGGLHFLGQ